MTYGPKGSCTAFQAISAIGRAEAGRERHGATLWSRNEQGPRSEHILTETRPQPGAWYDLYVYIYILKDVCSLGRVDFRVDML